MAIGNMFDAREFGNLIPHAKQVIINVINVQHPVVRICVIRPFINSIREYFKLW